MSAADVVALFEHRRPDGTPLYGDDVIDLAIPFLALSAGVDVATAPAPLQRVMLRFAERVGLTTTMDPSAVTSAIDAFFEQNPLPPALFQDLQALMRRLTAEGGGADDRARQAGKLLGDTAALLPVGNQPAPAGAIKNSPLARFQTVPPKKPR